MAKNKVVYVCLVCPKHYKTKAELLAHMEKRHIYKVVIDW